MGAHASAVTFVGIYKAVDLVVVRRRRDIVSVLAMLQVSVLAVAETGVAGHAHVGQVVNVVAAVSLRDY